ncbi:MAG TPA: Maf family protein [Rhodothermales bacterium]|nr:Maf family protein [Rhodothermales bacterium]
MIRFQAPLLLASQSPRRKQLLQMLGWDFRVQPSDITEIVPENFPPPEVVMSLARQKVEDLIDQFPESLILAADTIVVLDEVILGKPKDPEEAFQMLKMLSGRSNTVFTGICLAQGISKRMVTAVEQSEVFFYPMSDIEIRRYVASGSPMDKAGAYGIQDDWGALFIERIEGDYYNVMGLPLHLLYKTLKLNFADLWQMDE